MMMKRMGFRLFGLAVLLAVLGCMTCAQADEEQGQPLSTALRVTYANNPTLKAARSELRAVHESLPQAMAGWKPTISAGTGITGTDVDGGNSGDGSTQKEVSLSLNQPIWQGGSTFAATKAARNLIRAQNEVLKSVEQEVILEAATAYMDVVRDKALLELSKNNRDVIARQLEATKDRFEVGEITRTDVSQSEARLARAESDVIRSRGTLSASMAAYEQTVGATPVDLSGPDIMIDLPASLDEALELADKNNPAILSARFTHESAEHDVDDVYGELLPSVDISGSWSRLYDPSPGLIEKQTSKSIGLSASIPLYQAGSVRSRIREAKQTANQRYIEIMAAQRLVRQKVVSSWENLEAARAEIVSRGAQVEAARIAREGVHQETEVGARTILDALDADQELLDAQVSLVTAERNEVVASFELAEALGLLVPEILGFQELAIDHTSHLDAVTRKIFSLDAEIDGEESESPL